jgi:hypothetical protein
MQVSLPSPGCIQLVSGVGGMATSDLSYFRKFWLRRVFLMLVVAIMLVLNRLMQILLILLDSFGSYGVGLVLRCAAGIVDV